MDFQRVSADDTDQVDQVAAIRAACAAVDDPDHFPILRSEIESAIRYGRDLDPEEFYLCAPEPGADPHGFVSMELPTRDNRHLIWADVFVHPAARRAGHGTQLMAFVLGQAAARGRNTVWIGLPSDDAGVQRFAARHGFRRSSADARRRQVLADLDHAALATLNRQARAASKDYRLERLVPPIPDDVLEEMVEVTSAINDAPMGELTFEDEQFDLERIRDTETARERAGLRRYRIVAREVATGKIGGHTELTIEPSTSRYGIQHDTAVSRAHRGHRLGMRLKLDMLRWLAEAEPQLAVIETWNNIDNRFMIDVNEAMGYRLSRVFDVWQRTLTSTGQ